MTTIQQFFKWGLDRDIPALLDPPGRGYQIDLGPGSKKTIPYITSVQSDKGPGREMPTRTLGVGDLKTNTMADVQWWAPEPLPFDDESVSVVHAHQFMEHLDADTAIAVLREVERVLVPGGVMFMTTPYPGHGHFFQALDHKSMWTEETWNWLFGNEYYGDHEGQGWKLSVHACFMLGVVYRNLDLFTQLVREG